MSKCVDFERSFLERWQKGFPRSKCGVKSQPWESALSNENVVEILNSDLRQGHPCQTVESGLIAFSGRIGSGGIGKREFLTVTGTTGFLRQRPS
jgi:hypothetical protein